MIGNDVVDLRDPDVAPGARHPRFDARVFAPEERAQIARSGSPDRVRWIFWAAKEAAYKVARKLDAHVVFSPSRFVVALDPTLRGEVRFGEARFPVRVEVLPEAVHAVATSQDVSPEHVRFELHALAVAECDAGRAVRERAVRALAGTLHAEPGELSVGRHDRIPHLEVRGCPVDADLSLSHHGGLVAWACEIGEGARHS